MISPTVSEADILEKVLPKKASLSPELARFLLKSKFDTGTTRRIRQLLQKNQRGTISAEERLALERYLRVGQFLDLLHAHARLALKNHGESD